MIGLGGGLFEMNRRTGGLSFNFPTMKKSINKKAALSSGLLFAGILSLNVLAGDIPVSQGQFSQTRFRTSVNLTEGYDDNTQTSNTNRQESGFTGIQVNTFADLGNSRTAFTIGVGAGLTYYYDRPGTKLDKLASLTLNVAHRLNERLTLSLNSYLTYQVEPDFTLLVAQNRVNGQYFYTGDTLSATYQWTRRFQTVTSYQFLGIFYQDSAAKVANDYMSHTFGNQFRFVLTPTTTVIGEYRLGMVEYLYQTQRNSLTNSFLGGLEHSFSPKFTVSMRVGAQVQSQNQGGSATSPYGEGTLSYAYRHYSNITGYLRYGFDYSNVGVGQTDKALRAGLTITHGITPKLSVYLGFFYQHDDYSTAGGSATSGTTNDTFNITTGVRFAVSPRFSLSLGYTRTQLISNSPSQEYDRDVVTLGAAYTF